MKKEPVIYIDGKFYPAGEAKISVFDHGLLYGDGVFEGIRLYNRRVFKLAEHIDRLYSSAQAINMQVPVSKEEMMEIVAESCRKNGLDSGYIRLVVTRGSGDLGLDPKKCPKPTIFCIADVISLYADEYYENGLPVFTSSQRRNKATIVDPQIKSLNYLNNIMAKMEAAIAHAFEALMLNEDGIVAECTGDNIFVVKDGELYTPPAWVGLLEGITRNSIIGLARKSGMKVNIEPFTLFNVYNADECFLTGTAAELVPVNMVDNRLINGGKVGPVTKKLLQMFRGYTKTEGYPID